MPQEKPERPDLTGEYRWNDAIQISILIGYMLIWGLDSFYYEFSTFLVEYDSYGVRIFIALAILVASALISRSGFKKVFSERRVTPQVIKEGIFLRVRHPIYLGAILFYFGMAIFSFSIIAFVLSIFIFLYYHFVSRYEEKLLLVRFGDEYQEYQDSVPMWILRLGKPRDSKKAAEKE
ncbi:methyltransferase family protein [Patescibacteria group bacterium]